MKNLLRTFINKQVDDQTYLQKNNFQTEYQMRSDLSQTIRERPVNNCAAHIGMDGMSIEKEPRQKDEFVYRISQEVQGPSTSVKDPKFQPP